MPIGTFPTCSSFSIKKKENETIPASNRFSRFIRGSLVVTVAGSALTGKEYPAGRNASAGYSPGGNTPELVILLKKRNYLSMYSSR
jgi:hypothetical protein